MDTKRTKVLCIITKSNFGGAQRYVYEIATHLPKDSFDVTVAFGGNGLLKEKLDGAGIRTLCIKSLERDIHVLKDISVFKEVHTIIGNEKPDIVHLNSSKIGGIGALAARILGVKRIIFTAHGWPYFENRNPLSKILIWALSWVTTLLSHVVIVVSRHDLKKARMYGLTHKLEYIPTSVPDIHFLSKSEARNTLFPLGMETKHDQDTWLCTVAELTQNKNIFTAIDAVAKYNHIHEKKIFYTILGDGELREKIQTYIQQKKLGDSIHLYGYLDDARKYLKAFDLFLLPSIKEGLPYALLEAGRAHLPCIGSNVGGIPEVLMDGEAGLLIDPIKPETIIAALHDTIEHIEMTQRRSNTLHTLIEKEFSLEKMIQSTTALYTTH